MSGKARRGAVGGKKKMVVVSISLAVMLAAAFLLLLRPGDARAGVNYIVSNTDDSGDGSLRSAITQANALTGADNIIFSIPGDGPFTIQPTTPLPAITSPVTINGYSQPGSSAASGTTPAVLMIEISGASAGFSTSGLVFTSSSPGSVVKGLAINNFNGVGIDISTNSVTVEGNHIGTNVGGTAVAANASNGVYINNSWGCTIGGDTAAKRNVISGNGNIGITVYQGNTNYVQGNYIGTNASGTADIGNSYSGVRIAGSSGNIVGGGTTGQGNVISGNGTHGVHISDGSTNNNVQGNYIGTNASGTTALGNTSHGIFIDTSTGNIIGGDTAAKRNVISGNDVGVGMGNSSSANNLQGNYIGTNAGGTAGVGNITAGIYIANSTGNTIGGDTAAKRNVISGNSNQGVYFSNNANNNNLQGNYIGTDAGGSAPVENKSYGIYVTGSTGNTIGGDTAAKRNVISGNKSYGAYFCNASNNNNIQGNYIGTDAGGAADVGNTSGGISISGSTGNTIGGDTAAKRNVISGNGGIGVSIGSASNGTNIQGNYIGTDAGGTAALGNDWYGVFFSASTDCDVTGNRIWNNVTAGVYLNDKDAYGIRISQNSLYGNTGLGIVLSGVGANDGNNNNNTQPNRGYDYPVFSAAQYTVLDGAGNVSGTAPPNAWVELYKTGTTPDPSGAGEGLTYLMTVQANGSGAFSAALTDLAHDDYLSALAISPTGDASGEGNTSKFAANALIQAQYTITATAGSGGSITPSGAVIVNHGAGQTFTIKPDDGYHVVSVADNGNPVTPVPTTSYVINNVTAAHTVVVTFSSDAFPPTPAPIKDLSTWYLAEGSTNWGFDCYVSIENPNDTAVNVKLTYMTTSGPKDGGTVKMPAKSQATVFPASILGAADFSTKVECLEAKLISVDRTMYWTGPTSSVPEAHCATGVTAPATTWYLPEGCSDYGFECYLLIQNPNAAAANCTVTWMIEGETPATSSITVPASSRANLNMADEIGARNASIKVVSDRPVIPERAMYRNDRREGHDSGGTPSAANDYYLAEGCTGFGFTTYILVQNPQDTETKVTVNYQATAGPVTGPSFTMPANSRKTICVNSTTPIPGDDPSFSTHVRGSQPIIAERAMYWNGGPDGAEVCHDSIGLDQPYTNWYLADGQSSEGRETWTLVQNPNDTAVKVEITYMTPDGTGNVVKAETIAAGSRKSFNMAEHSGINSRAAIMVRCTTSGKKVMCERAMYWNDRGTGTDTIGGYSD